MSKKRSSLEQLVEDAKAYLQRRGDLCRLELVDKLSVILGLLFAFLVLGLLLLVAVGYFSVAIVNSLSICMPVWAACCIMGGVFILLSIVAFLCRRPLFINPLIRFLSGILFQNNERKEDENETLE